MYAYAYWQMQSDNEFHRYRVLRPSLVAVVGLGTVAVLLGGKDVDPGNLEPRN